MARIIGLTQGDNVPSSRFRFQQYIAELKVAGLDVVESSARFGAYAPSSLLIRPFWLAAALGESLVRAVNTANYDLCFLQRNLIATLGTWEALIKKPLVFDVDDAIFFGQRFGCVDNLARQSSLVICGNNYLANYFDKFAPVVVVPTAVDTDIFQPKIDFTNCKNKVIGWSGTSGGFRYLYAIEPALLRLVNMHPDVVIKVVSDRCPVFATLPAERVIFEPWHPATEVQSIHDFSVGVMPLTDDPWSRGKCSFKMLTYMATGLPVVVSPVGMNIEILSQGLCGIAAKTMDDWVDAISTLLLDSTLAKKMGQTGRSIVETHYARNVIAPKLAQLLKKQL